MTTTDRRRPANGSRHGTRPDGKSRHGESGDGEHGNGKRVTRLAMFRAAPPPLPPPNGERPPPPVVPSLAFTPYKRKAYPQFSVSADFFMP